MSKTNSEISLTIEEAMELFPKHLQKKVQYSVNLLRKAEKLAKAYDPDNGYYLAFSGGKDSQALYHVARLAGVQFKAHMNFTSVDPADVIRFVRREYPDVHTIPPKDSIYNIAIRMRLLPTRRARWCCKEFKESAGAGKVTLIGIRLAESFRRSKRNWIKAIKAGKAGAVDNRYIWLPKNTEPTDVQQDEIAENIFDYWISGKNYKKWYKQ